MCYYFHLDKEIKFYEHLKWTLKTLSQYAQIEICFVEQETKAQYIINSQFGDVILNYDFWENILNKKYDNILLNDNLYVLDKDGKEDYLATAFYFVNCLWEYKKEVRTDKFDRHEFQYSVWKDKGKTFTIVNSSFDKILNKLKIPLPKIKTSIHLSHDIDSIYGSFFQDGFSMLRKKQFSRIIPFVFNTVIQGPQWFNFKKIANTELKYNYKSSFFWLVEKGKTKFGVSNSDYNILNKKLGKAIKWLDEKGFENGLHKSISDQTHQEEIIKLPFGNCISNRNHFLKYDFKNLITSISNSEIEVDYSLGYVEVLGYRNGYSLPFVPFDLEKNKPSNFVEVPLAIMDGTLSKYLKLNVEESLALVKQFIIEHEYNSVISILWHNSNFTDYKYEGFPRLYEEILKFAKEKDFISLNSKQIKNRFNEF